MKKNPSLLDYLYFSYIHKSLKQNNENSSSILWSYNLDWTLDWCHCFLLYLNKTIRRDLPHLLKVFAAKSKKNKIRNLGRFFFYIYYLKKWFKLYQTLILLVTTYNLYLKIHLTHIIDFFPLLNITTTIPKNRPIVHIIIIDNMIMNHY